MHQSEKCDPNGSDSVRHRQSNNRRFLLLTPLGVLMAIMGFTVPAEVFDAPSIATVWQILRPLMIIVGSTGALYYGCMAVIGRDANGDFSGSRTGTEKEPLEERIRQYVERIELDPSTAVMLTDIAPLPEWEAELRAGHAPQLIESFVRRTSELLAFRYPKALPFPYERLYRVGRHEGWWTAPDPMPYEAIIGYFAEFAGNDPTETAPAPSPTDRGDEPVLLRATLAVTLAIFHSVRGQASYRTDQ